MQGMPLQNEPEEGHCDGAQQIHVQGMVHSLPSDEFYQASHIGLRDATPAGQEVLPRSMGDDAEDKGRDGSA